MPALPVVGAALAALTAAGDCRVSSAAARPLRVHAPRGESAPKKDSWGRPNAGLGRGVREKAGEGGRTLSRNANSGPNQQISDSGAAKASVVLSPLLPADEEFWAIVEAWPALPETIRAGIAAIVRAATSAERR